MLTCKPALTKEEFCNSIKFILNRNSAMNKINKLFTEEFEDSVFYPYFKYETELVKVLKIIMKDNTDESWIDYFLYELDGGTKWTKDSVTYADGTPIKLKTPEDLYEFLIEEHFSE